VEWKPYVSVAARRAKAERELARLGKKKGARAAAPVVITGRAIAHTFWGKAWCDNLERYSDYASRLPRGRSYVRNGSVVDLRIDRGEVVARVSGSSLYTVEIAIAAVPAARWQALRTACAGEIDSLVELLQGRLSGKVMERLCARGEGLFPAPAEIELACTCPDWASMCKHVAAALYGVGARLDEAPELLFTLRGVDSNELLAGAAAPAALAGGQVASGRVLQGEDLAALFGLDLAPPVAEAAPAVKKGTGRTPRTPARTAPGTPRATSRRRR
jgi:hypothetical protein